MVPDHPGRRIPLADFERRDRSRNQEEIRARCRTVVIRSDMAVTQVLGRYKMYVDPGDYSLAVHLMMDGYWEIWLTEEIMRIVKPGMVVADIGANFGYFTLIMADLVGPKGHVLAFEPNPHAAALLQRSLCSNGMEKWASIEQNPLGAVSGLPVTLLYNPELAGGAFVGDEENSDFSVAIPHVTRRFDEHPRAHQVAVVKIDAEGSEERIWEGMAAQIAGNVLRIIVLEWCSFRYANPGQFLDSILAAGFELSYIDPLHGVVSLDREGLLARAPDQEWLLLLRR
ncbi:FkbM family methyltransferase [Sphingobium cupriresistens]|uniref:FkbM family methyltransferase n=1 Tax=Sphingobium cupriresistens TaxID=1132417 RepID=A0A8G1ZI64_9SPHN|nr:FkbM family methyltransferase [Sphingobium cupriresistens]RYM11111.1 FkbM family methyltransferase [Sphingobium cupriresistens]